MKNTRKKMLLSSIAMLLVALVALGSATYAWFTTNPKAEATGIKMKTTASKGLVIKTESQNVWGHDQVLRYDQTADASNPAAFNLTPVSMEQGDASTYVTNKKFWTIDAGAANKYVHDDTKTMDEATEDKDYYSEKIYFALSAGANTSDAQSDKVYIKGVSLSAANASTSNLEGTIRVAIVSADNKLLGTWALDSKDPDGTLTTASKTPGTFNPELVVAASSGLSVDTGATALASEDSDPATKYVTVYVYMDGQDKNCKTTNVKSVDATAIISSINIKFELAA